MPETIETALTKLLGIKYPIMLAGMNIAAGPGLAAAVTNAGGLGVIGGVNYTPEMLRETIEELKADLVDKSAPFGVDLLLPKVGKGARATNYDYTKGKLPQLVDIIIESGAKLFVSAVGVPPKWVVEKCHKAGILVMNMIGSPKHVKYCLAAGVDIICAQGGEGGGHTGDVATSILIPAVVDLCKHAKSPLTGERVHVVAAGGIYDGRGLAMSLALGSEAVWVGTRFVASDEAGAPPRHKNGVVSAGFHDTIRTLIYTGRPLRIKKSNYVMHWEQQRAEEIKALCNKGKLPYEQDLDELKKMGRELTFEEQIDAMPLLMGQVAGCIKDIKPAKAIIEEMMSDAIKILKGASSRISKL
mmetsp:Transcript_3363/g.6282  ORF Transcript_3363/g.6282 Transcript_3363/m.6282 type:complete len:357 (-) Transcript_3363:75-1145(-)|eukprot:CAMPEP_0197524644 /NCGR_PEP_ID=MMETSP1318-20131121/9254_1 /TAXON_ID=552666 /ORGANISM="Partenskyella glossopodia, Strain RCC365" /LENGTH=356 /DNA_ID=CAMNT_0043077633 /DNA_START=101 /DNA_END=1171 /DNA_ORIENTATION=+